MKKISVKTYLSEDDHKYYVIATAENGDIATMCAATDWETVQITNTARAIIAKGVIKTFKAILIHTAGDTAILLQCDNDENICHLKDFETACAARYFLLKLVSLLIDCYETTQC